MTDKPEPEPFGYFNNPECCGWQDCAENDPGAIPLYEHETVQRLQEENALLHKALRQTVRTYMVDDQTYDPEAMTERAMNIVMERARK